MEEDEELGEKLPSLIVATDFFTLGLAHSSTARIDQLTYSNQGMFLP